jgi:hypothetical protein
MERALGELEAQRRSGDHSELTKLIIDNGERRTTTYGLIGRASASCIDRRRREQHRDRERGQRAPTTSSPRRGNRQEVVNVGGATQQQNRAATTLLGLAAARQARCKSGCFN